MRAAKVGEPRGRLITDYGCSSASASLGAERFHPPALGRQESKADEGLARQTHLPGAGSRDPPLHSLQGAKVDRLHNDGQLETRKSNVDIEVAKVPTRCPGIRVGKLCPAEEPRCCGDFLTN